MERSKSKKKEKKAKLSEIKEKTASRQPTGVFAGEKVA